MYFKYIENIKKFQSFNFIKKIYPVSFVDGIQTSFTKQAWLYAGEPLKEVKK